MADKKKKEKKVTFTQKDVDEYCSAIQKAFDTDKKIFVTIHTTEFKSVMSFGTSLNETIAHYVVMAENSKYIKIALNVASTLTR